MSTRIEASQEGGPEAAELSLKSWRDIRKARRARRSEAMRTASVEDAHEDALDDDRSVRVYPELGAAKYLHLEAITEKGLRVSYLSPSADERLTVTVWPQSWALWSMILEDAVRVERGVTLGTILRLLDVAPEVDAHLAPSLLRWLSEPPSLAPYQEGARAERGVERDDDDAPIAAIVVSATLEGDERKEERAEEMALPPGVSLSDVTERPSYYHYYDATGVSEPLTESQAIEMHWKAGERINYSLSGIPIALLLATPVVYDPRLTIPGTHEEWLAFREGPYKAWRNAGEVGDPPAMPVLREVRFSCSLREFLGALLQELSPSAR